MPYSKLMGLTSSQFHQDSGPEDHRIWIAPKIPVFLSSQNYFNASDPAMAAILDVIRQIDNKNSSELWFLLRIICRIIFFNFDCSENYLVAPEVCVARSCMPISLLSHQTQMSAPGGSGPSQHLSLANSYFKQPLEAGIARDNASSSGSCGYR